MAVEGDFHHFLFVCDLLQRSVCPSRAACNLFAFSALEAKSQSKVSWCVSPTALPTCNLTGRTVFRCCAGTYLFAFKGFGIWFHTRNMRTASSRLAATECTLQYLALRYYCTIRKSNRIFFFRPVGSFSVRQPATRPR